MPIIKLTGYLVYDSYGYPTVETELTTDCGLFRCQIPTTEMRRPGEVVHIRDGNPKLNDGLGVQTACKNINNIIAPELIKAGYEVTMQREIDTLLNKLDGTEYKSRLGANALLAVSLICAKAAAARKRIPLYLHIADLNETHTPFIPCPHITILAGGTLSTNCLPYQEYSVIPVGAKSFAEAMNIGTTIYKTIKNYALDKYGIDSTWSCESGAISIPFEAPKDAVDLLFDTVNDLEYTGKVEFGLNVSAGDFYFEGAYDMDWKETHSNPNDFVGGDKLIETYLEFSREYNITSFEDGWDSSDWCVWTRAKARAPPTIQILANDATVMNMKRLTNFVDKKMCTATAIKINQAATLTDIMDIYKFLKSNNIVCVVEDRLAETTDPFLADLCVGLGAGQIKCGAPLHSERIGKYNQILRIEEELGPMARYAGRKYRW